MPDTLAYRFARSSEIPEVGRLVAHSFPGPLRSPAWWREQLEEPLYGGGAGTLFVGVEAGRIVAACQLHPLHQWIAGEALPVAGVGTVAISPVHRKRRIAAELVSQGLRAARERGDVASALYPFRTSFYRKLGYGQSGHVLQYQVPPETLPESAERARMELLDDERGRADALELYARWARQQNGQLLRGEPLWQHLCTAQDRSLAGYRAADGVLEGYALVTYRTDLPPQSRYLEVDELVWATPDARRALHGWLASLGDQWQQLLIRALPAQRLGDWLREPRLPGGSAPAWGLWTPAATLLAGPMFRLLDIPAAWQRRRVVHAEPLTVGLEVVDAQLPENHGRWRLALEDGRVAVAREGAADLTLRLDISTLSRLYTNALSARAAADAGLLECDHTGALARLDHALALPEPWTFDRF